MPAKYRKSFQSVKKYKIGERNEKKFNMDSSIGSRNNSGIFISVRSSKRMV